MRAGALGLLVVVVGLGGCGVSGAHVQLNPLPPRNAPFALRWQAYRVLAPVQYEETHYYNQHGSYTGMSSKLELPNHLVIHHAEDLLPLVTPESEVARAVGRSREKSRTSSRAYAIGISALLVGIGLIAYSDDNPIGYILAGGGLVTSFVGWEYSREADGARSTAFVRYDASLRERLGICQVDLEVLDCDAVPAPAPGSTP